MASDFDAIWSATLGAVECKVEPYKSNVGIGAALPRAEREEATTRHVLGELGFEIYDEEGDEILLGPTARLSLEVTDHVRASVGACSDAWAVWQNLVRNPHEGEPVGVPVVRRELTLRVEGAEVPDVARAGDLLERLGDASLFELDLASGVGLRLVRWARGLDEPAPVGIQYLPTRLFGEYDPKPMSLYRYGRSAWGAGMPLLAFLAFYQVLEYHFPAYSPSKQVDALRDKLREIAGDVKESDVDGVLDAIGIKKRRLLPEEKSQLSSTIKGCVRPEELERFLTGDEERAEYYRSGEWRRLSRHEVLLGGRDGKGKDARQKVAERVYEIRNRVVHTKAHSEEPDPLLPFDPEVSLLNHDLALVRFLAGKALAASAWPPRG
jgi:hypothetical protein